MGIGSFPVMASTSATDRSDPDRRIVPLHQNVIVEREVEAVTAGGILIPETARDQRKETITIGDARGGMSVSKVDSDAYKRHVLARVVSVGPGRTLPDGRRVGPICAVGNRVVLEKWEGLEFCLDGRDLLLMDEGGILGVVEE